MNTGLLLLRGVVGGLILGHASQKAFGLFGGGGPEGTAPMFEKWGFVPGKSMVKLAATTESVGSGMLLLGAGTPLGAAMVSGTLAVAASVNAKNGLWAMKGGYELPLLYAAGAGVLGFTGPGEYSVDGALGLTKRYGVASGLASLALAAVPATAFIVWSQRNRAEAEAEEANEETVPAN
ncbi:DoxX family protein [Brevibacterium sp. 2SA]|uniref:DoxX family protein n=1 Tax=Brevibacterium sp. 2SA TaxID=2502198 RepID=UPI0010F44A06|nr:DoxX family protein [Brevibacterium sp. 2SA]